MEYHDQNQHCKVSFQVILSDNWINYSWSIQFPYICTHYSKCLLLFYVLVGVRQNQECNPVLNWRLAVFSGTMVTLAFMITSVMVRMSAATAGVTIILIQTYL